MATPTLEELLQGGTTWRKDHEGISFELSHHGHRTGREYASADPHPGTWCYYLIIPEQMYPHRWQDFACFRSEYGYESHGPAFEHDMFDSEITWSSSQPYWDRKTERQWDASKVGCDYGHLWHMERGYPDTFQSVEADARRTVEAFLKANPDRRLRCEYSGVWGEVGDFYTARNGRRVHTSQVDKFNDGWDSWLPAEQVPA